MSDRTLSVIKGGNQPEPWSCCDNFAYADREEIIVATNKGWAVLGEGDVVLFDVTFCPFCGVKLPEIKDKE